MWIGRNDGEESIHNRVFKCLNTSSSNKLIGFCSSLGVDRNHGRVGSELAPNIIRKNMANFAVFDDFSFDDLGNIDNFKSLEEADDLLYDKLNLVLKNQDYCVILGGGHETSLAGIKALLDNKQNVGVINFDAHFDVRIQPQHTSGNSFYEAYKYAKSNNYSYKYLCIGANALSNTQALFNTMQDMNAKYVLDKDFDNSAKIVKEFILDCDVLYLSIDIDVFSLSYAPGVSAPAVYGISLQQILPILKIILDSKKVALADICEFNPKYDIDNHTAKLSAYLAYILLRKAVI
ncbi:formimidoylglutamase [Campylobacter sp. RM12642]|uniref:formimidoylglutamase n=1 Tax=unclassified Campylobacter TaxID=2593542 RepID=UPI001BDAD131|nr:formimidoylglutamase [Campylobacter sp. 2018MI01]MBT0878343.1 formimidoylglutamase [Campylobacter sp. 2018MI01]MBZ7980207.1 formimidoylglutamase [Campylobacter sp. RM12642]MBZ7993280.1 formimidoylglutamase [Campylobacter sp. RM9333]